MEQNTATDFESSNYENLFVYSFIKKKERERKPHQVRTSSSSTHWPQFQIFGSEVISARDDTTSPPLPPAGHSSSPEYNKTNLFGLRFDNG